ncbi:MAG: tRNA lysidine(34) synthetase TilS [Desulfobulbaceae bacterium]|nr:tRNA lysidine(34) synthetase TilS [Desulfobulbaceae bacterium]
MHPLEKQILAIIREEGLVSQGETVVVGVSAGPDSMALLHLFATLSSKLKMKLVAVYVDHGLRPDETTAEVNLVQECAEKLGVIFETTHVSVEQEASRQKKSTEHAARDLRYAFFEKVSQKYQASKVAVAHTADDQAEEVLLRLIRGTGRSGLSGMRMIRDGIIIRPLLTTAKKALHDYLEDRHISFAIDSSNLQRIYLRNRIRLDLIPFLEKFNPNISETLRQTASVLQDEEKVLRSLTESLWRQIATAETGTQEDVLPALSIDLQSFLALEKGLQRRIMEKAFVLMQSQPQYKKIEQILFVARKGETGARLHFSKGLRLKKFKDRLLFSYPGGKTATRGNLEK